jgi:deoxyribodipyrimidine photolyase-related protein
VISVEKTKTMGAIQPKYKTLRLILGDQLNEQHIWFKQVEPDVLYVMMEIRSETDYVVHHIQKVVGIFTAMREFYQQMKAKGHQFHYIKINDAGNNHTFVGNIKKLVDTHEIKSIEFQTADEYRVEAHLRKGLKEMNIPYKEFSTEHFIVEKQAFEAFFKDKKQFMMEFFYRYVRKQTGLLMENGQPIGGKWNFDSENRKKIPKTHVIQAIVGKTKEVHSVFEEISNAGISTIGTVDPSAFIWPTNRVEALEILEEFIEKCLPFFGTFQDAMTVQHPFIYHSRLSFALNIKLINPLEVCIRVEKAYHENQKLYTLNQVEGFIRQIIGWREYMRGIYLLKMPEYEQLNYFGHSRKLPAWFWDGKTKMNCLKKSISQSLTYAYAHHIQRLMVTGNFALLAGIDPDEVDRWYLGIYIDAFQWVEITNTRGMSQFADGGIVGTKPYVSSGSYISKMGDYCDSCYYKHTEKIGEKACPFNSLYWHFYFRNRSKLEKNPRISLVYRTWDKMSLQAQSDLLEQAEKHLADLDSL